MIYLGSDHGGYELKEKIKKWLAGWGMEYEDLGNTVYDKDDDYPLFAKKVAEKVTSEEALIDHEKTSWKDRPKGILTCRSAAGMVITANKTGGARCATAFNEKAAEQGRMHNDTNILALSGDWLEDYTAKNIVKAWLSTEFSEEERHRRRVGMIREWEKGGNK